MNSRQATLGCQPAHTMAGYYKLEDEVLPSFLCESMDSSSGRATLGNVTLGSGPGLPVAASTVAKIRPSSDNRWELAAALGRCDLFVVSHRPFSARVDTEIIPVLFGDFCLCSINAEGVHTESAFSCLSTKNNVELLVC